MAFSNGLVVLLTVIKMKVKFEISMIRFHILYKLCL